MWHNACCLNLKRSMGAQYILLEVKIRSQNKEGKEMTGTQKLVLTSSIVILTVLFSACSHVMIPRGPIPVKMDVVGAMNVNKAISVQNDVPDSKLVIITSQGFTK